MYDDTLVLQKEEVNIIIEEGYEQAEKTIKDKSKVEKILLELEQKMKELPKGLGSLAYLPIMGSMINDYIKKRYKGIPVSSIVYALIAIIYVINPIDLIPDNIPVIGYIDDAGVVLAALPFIKKDLDDYVAWRNRSE